MAVIYLFVLNTIFNFIPEQDDALSKSIGRGKIIYTDFCMNCHGPEGQGTKSVFPPLASSDFLINNREVTIQSVKYGLKGPIIVNGAEYFGTMPSPRLTDDEVCDVLNFVYSSWNNKMFKMVTLSEVKAVKAKS